MINLKEIQPSDLPSWKWDFYERCDIAREIRQDYYIRYGIEKLLKQDYDLSLAIEKILNK